MTNAIYTIYIYIYYVVGCVLRGSRGGANAERIHATVFNAEREGGGKRKRQRVKEGLFRSVINLMTIDHDVKHDGRINLCLF